VCPNAVKSCDLDGAYGLPGVKKDKLTGRLFVRGEIVKLDVEQIVPHRPPSARHRDDLGYIKIWSTPSRRLVFWDDAPSPQRTC